MSVEIIRSKEDESVIDKLAIQYELPSAKEISDIKSIGVLLINNISDSRKLQEFLESMSMIKIRNLVFTFCNMQDIDFTLFEQLQPIENIGIAEIRGISYNDLLGRIHNKSKVKMIFLWDCKESKNDLDVTLLEEFKGLEYIILKNISGMDMQALQAVLSGVGNLREFIFEGDIQSLDLRIITPEIARAHEKIYLDTTKGIIDIERTEDEQGYKLRMSTKCIAYIDEITSLVNNADDVQMDGKDEVEIHIDNKNKLKSLIENKHFLKDVPGISIIVPHIGMITDQELEELKSQTNIRKTRVMDPEYDKGKEEGFEYTLEQYEILHKKVQEIVGDIPEEFTDLQKFMIIYLRLGSTIIYDNKLIEEENKEKDDPRYKSEYAKENSAKARNLFNGLIKGKSVCAGYADILYNCLNAVGIETCKIGGKDHTWNKVKLDGVWYNVDLTWDCKDITQHNARGLKCCLRSDEEFQEGHEQTEGKKVDCNHDYPREEVVRAFRFAERFNDRALDAEYELVAEEPSFFDKLKARAMISFGKRKVIAEPEQTGTSESHKIRRWQRTSEIVVRDKGQAVQEKGIDNGAVVTTQNTENPQEPKEPGDE